MPNQCHNTLVVVGAGRGRLRDFVRSKDGIDYFRFDHVLPVPDHLLSGGAISDEGAELIVGRWGTGELGRVVDVADHKSKLHINFTTAYSPPLKVVEALIRNYPSLRFTFYYEAEDTAFKGMLKGRNGKVVRETYKEK